MKHVDISISNLPKNIVTLLFNRIKANIDLICDERGRVLNTTSPDYLIFKQYDFENVNIISKMDDSIICVITSDPIIPIVYDAIKQNDIVQDNHGTISFTYFEYDEKFIDSEIKKIKRDFSNSEYEKAFRDKNSNDPTYSSIYCSYN